MLNSTADVVVLIGFFFFFFFLGLIQRMCNIYIYNIPSFFLKKKKKNLRRITI